MRVALRLLFPILILAVGLGIGYYYWNLPEEEVPPHLRAKRPAQKAEVIPLVRQEYQVVIRTRGIVQAHSTTSLTPRIGGRIESFHPNFEVGAFFKRGDVLVTLDPTDTESGIIAAEAQLARAEAALVQEEARSNQALMNWEDLGYTTKPNDLVLRIPQLREAKANLKTANAELEEARRNKLYTKIIAPFDGCVRERFVGPGQSVGQNTNLAEIFATDYAEVRLPISPKDLPYTPFQNQSVLPQIPAVLQDALADDLNGEAPTWKAELMRSEGVIDETSRELFLIARIPDPYGLKSGAPPLRVGQPIVAQLPGNLLKDVYVIPRISLRSAFETLLVDNDTSKIIRTTVEPYWTDADNLIVTQDLPENHSIVVTRIPSAGNGGIIEIIDSEKDDEGSVEAAQNISVLPSNSGA